jgi:multiple sugar transport system permease protein
MALKKRTEKKRSFSHEKWGYLFIMPFFLAFLVFFCIPLGSSIFYSFFEFYSMGIAEVGPNFTGLDNYISLLESDLPKYFMNTFIMWLGGFIPQLFIALVIASWFTDARQVIYGRKFFRMVIYMPGVIMASAWSMIFFTLFSQGGPINSLLKALGIIYEPVLFFNSVAGMRILICILLFIVNLGNSLILLIATIMGTDADIYCSALIDGCSHFQAFFRVVVPTLSPVISYIVITSMISGIQMFDLPQILTDGKGSPDRSTMTLIMYLNRHLLGNNYGMAGALSVYLFLVSGVLCYIIYRIFNKKEDT